MQHAIIRLFVINVREPPGDGTKSVNIALVPQNLIFARAVPERAIDIIMDTL